jgi:hypothetical protein
LAAEVVDLAHQHCDISRHQGVLTLWGGAELLEIVSHLGVVIVA